MNFKEWLNNLEDNYMSDVETHIHKSGLKARSDIFNISSTEVALQLYTTYRIEQTNKELVQTNKKLVQATWALAGATIILAIISIILR